MLWTAPELLVVQKNMSGGSQKGDVYSFGIVCQEVVLQDMPYGHNIPNLEPQEIVNRVKGKENPPYRPHLDAGLYIIAL